VKEDLGSLHSLSLLPLKLVNETGMDFLERRHRVPKIRDLIQLNEGEWRSPPLKDLSRPVFLSGGTVMERVMLC